MEILSLWRRQGKTDLPGLGLVFSCGWCILEIYISTTCWAVHIIYCGDTSNYKFCEIVCFSVWMCAMWLNWNIFISIFTSHIPNTITTRNTFQIRENTGLCWSGGLVSHQVNICPNWRWIIFRNFLIHKLIFYVPWSWQRYWSRASIIDTMKHPNEKRIFIWYDVMYIWCVVWAWETLGHIFKYCSVCNEC